MKDEWKNDAQETHSSFPKPLNSNESGPLHVEDVGVSENGVIRIIKLAELDKMNALSTRLLKEFRRHIDELKDQASSDVIRAVVIASAHDKAFCAGADLKERAKMTETETRSTLRQLRQTFLELADLKIPTIAAVHGYALGGGLELALCTHLRVFSQDAIVGMPEVGLGIIPGAGGTFRLPALIGRSRALDLMLTGRRLGAPEAHSWGLCDRVIEHGGDGDLSTRRLETLKGAMSLASKISLGAPISAQTITKAAHGNGTQEQEAEAYESIINTEDRREALAAFAEKRKPIFRGQ
ncbi:MAG: hypothetical protein M1831_005709 [Alyxoria varia]|nr:MAG: hypothetical protein M1831_005709 [Alyxoria varia]